MRSFLLTGWACILAWAWPTAEGATPLAWWKLNEGSGTIAQDSSGQGYSGNVVGTAAWQADGLSFNGNSDYVSINGFTGIGGQQSFTVSANVYFGADPSTFAGWIVEHLDGFSLYWSGNNLFGKGNNTLVFGYHGGSEVTAEWHPQINTWYQVRGVHYAETDELVLFADAQELKGVGTATASVNPSGKQIEIGRNTWAKTWNWKGRMNNVRVLTGVELPSGVIYNSPPTLSLSFDDHLYLDGETAQITLVVSDPEGAALTPTLKVDGQNVTLQGAGNTKTYQFTTKNAGRIRLEASVSDGSKIAAAEKFVRVGGSKLWAWWKLNEGSGSTAQDSSGNGHVGSVIGSKTWQTDSLSFNGSSDYISVTNFPGFARQQSFTLSANVLFDGDPTKRDGWIVEQLDGFSLFWSANNLFGHGGNALIFGTHGGSEVVATSWRPQPGSWHSIRAVRDAVAGEMLLYADGTQIAKKTGAWADTNASGKKLEIGRNTWAMQWYHLGKMKDVRFYNGVVLTDSTAPASANTAPSAQLAFTERIYQTGEAIALSLQGSDAEGDSLTATLAIGGQSRVLTGGSGNWNNTFTPTLAGTYLLRAVVSDGKLEAAVEKTLRVESASLVARWKLDEGSGTIAQDTSGQGHSGNVVGSTLWQAGSLNFNGSTDYVSVSSFPGFQGQQSFTISANVNFAGDPSQRAGWIVEHLDGFWLFWSGNNLFGHGGNTLVFGYHGGSEVAKEWHPLPETWHQIQAIHDATTDELILFADGVELGGVTTATGNVNASGKQLEIGRNTWAQTWHFKGLMNDVRLYNGVLLPTKGPANRAPALSLGFDDLLYQPGNVVNVQLNLSDPDGNPLTATLLVDGQAVTLQGSGNTRTYAHTILYPGRVRLTASVSDGLRSASTEGFVRVGGSNLVAWWKLNDLTGATALDATGNGYAGITSGSKSWQADSLYFNGSTDYVSVANFPGFARQQSFTLSASVKFSGDPSQRAGWIMEQLDGFSLYWSGNNLFGQGGNTMIFGYHGGGEVVAKWIPQPETWYEVQAQRDAVNGALILRVDGVELARKSGITADANASGKQLEIGRNTWAKTWHHLGSMKNLRLFRGVDSSSTSTSTGTTSGSTSTGTTSGSTGTGTTSGSTSSGTTSGSTSTGTTSGSTSTVTTSGSTGTGTTSGGTSTGTTSGSTSTVTTNAGTSTGTSGESAAVALSSGLRQVRVARALGGGTYRVGEMVELIAEAPPAGWVFDRWVGDVEGMENIFQKVLRFPMPSRNLQLTAFYKEAPGTASGNSAVVDPAASIASKIQAAAPAGGGGCFLSAWK